MSGQAMMAQVREHVDVLIIGAGISGIGYASHLRREHPHRSVALLEAREHLGGTWDLFRYPGIRSDSDLATFGYALRPWTGRNAIADAPSILRYLEQTADEFGVSERIRYGHRAVSARWSTAEGRWTVEMEVGEQRVRQVMTAEWVISASGYYRYDRGYTPEFPGLEAFEGPVVHPQAWDETVDYAGKRVVVIGSGATAVTLIPSLAQRAQHVTMLQRSPTYIMSAPAVDPIALALRRVMGDERGHALTRRKNIALTRRFYAFCQHRPRAARRLVKLANRAALPKGYDVDKHFTPRYDPWDQRMCLVPDGDLFKAIRAGKADVVTDRIAGFTADGITLESGQHLRADMIVTATGLDLQAFGGVAISIDGAELDVGSTFIYKGMMLSGVPNAAVGIGYTNASWTLKIDLAAAYLCRLLRRMDEQGLRVATPQAPPAGSESRPLLDFGAGYVQRAVDRFPRQGPGVPWVLAMDYAEDLKVLRDGPLTDHLDLDAGDGVAASHLTVSA